jgi:hypothetical protein
LVLARGRRTERAHATTEPDSLARIRRALLRPDASSLRRAMRTDVFAFSLEAREWPGLESRPFRHLEGLSMFARSSARILGGLLLLSLSALACNSAPRQRQEEEPAAVRGALGRLQELQPTDVAVAPIRDQTNAQRVPLELFRDSFIQTLVERRYSPLAPSYVDANWVEASFRGTPPPDGLLVVAVTSWDPSHLYSTGKVEAAADVVLFEGGDTTGRVLWQLTLEREVDLGDGRGNPPPAGQDLIPKAVRMFAQQALQSLPMRDPVAAHRPKTVQ